MMLLVQAFKNGITWYKPTEDRDSWLFFYQQVYSIDYTKANVEALKHIAWMGLKLETSVDVGMWMNWKERLSSFLASNIAVDGSDKFLSDSIQYKFIECFVNDYNAASHNKPLWKSINDCALGVLGTAYKTTSTEVSPSSGSFSHYWVADYIPSILDKAIISSRISALYPTEDAGTWIAFIHNTFKTSLLNRTYFVYQSAYSLSNIASSVDAGMWETMRFNACAFLDKYLGKLPESLSDQQAMAINFCKIFILPFQNATHNKQRWEWYAINFTEAIQKLMARTGELTNPVNRIATNYGKWGASSKFDMIAFKNPNYRKFSSNYYDTAWIVGEVNWHPQHVVRLPNKNGCAYFMVSQSHPFYGYITVLRTNPGMLDPETDLIRPVNNNEGIVGEYVWQEVFMNEYNGISGSVGSWSHPGKMGVIGGVLVVAAQNWKPIHHILNPERGDSVDKVLFFDVLDPEEPVYMGAMTQEQLGVKEISNASLVRTQEGKYLLCAGGDGTYATLVADKISVNVLDWQRFTIAPIAGKTIDSIGGQHGRIFNSHVPNTNPLEQEIVYFDADLDHNQFVFTPLKYNSEIKKITFQPTTPFPIDIKKVGNPKDWDTSSIYVSEKNETIIYTVKSGDWGTAYSSPYRLYQVLNPKKIL